MHSRERNVKNKQYLDQSFVSFAIYHDLAMGKIHILQQNICLNIRSVFSKSNFPTKHSINWKKYNE